MTVIVQGYISGPVVTQGYIGAPALPSDVRPYAMLMSVRHAATRTEGIDAEVQGTSRGAVLSDD